MSERPFPWRTLFFVSLALNLIGVSAIAGAGIARARLQEAGVASAARPMPARAFLRALPEEQRARVRASLVAAWTQSRAEREAARAAREDLLLAAQADPFDAGAMDEAFARMRAADAAVQARFQSAATQAFAQLTPAERDEAIARLGEWRRRLRGGGQGQEGEAP